MAINVGGATINVGSTTDTGQLYRADIEYSGAQPKVHFIPRQGFSHPSARHLRISTAGPEVCFDAAAQSRCPVVDRGQQWSRHDHHDLAQIRATSLSVNTGASQEEITLGPATGIVPVEINGGALTAHFHRAERNRGLGRSLGRRGQPGRRWQGHARDRAPQLRVDRFLGRGQRLPGSRSTGAPAP